MSTVESPPAAPTAPITPQQRRAVLVGMVCGASLASIDQMVLATAVGTIAGELGDLHQAPWIFTANLLASASSMPIWGKLGDLYGRRRVFQSAMVLFIVASLLAAQSGSIRQAFGEACRRNAEIIRAMGMEDRVIKLWAGLNSRHLIDNARTADRCGSGWDVPDMELGFTRVVYC